jgi:hypothetical protein
MSADTDAANSLFWDLIDELRVDDPRIEEGTIMGGRCARVAGEFLALVDYKNSGLVVKLPRERVDALIAEGVGRAFAPAGKVFREWVAIPQRNRRRWRNLLEEGIAFVAPPISNR